MVLQLGRLTGRLPGGWTFSEIVLYAQGRALERLDKLTHWNATLVAQQQGFATDEMGFRGQFAGQQSQPADVRFGSKADI
jgi:hypothetical protein